MNIEEIKKKLSVGEYGYHKDGLYGDNCEDADNDIEYLLSIIEQATDALKFYADWQSYHKLNSSSTTVPIMEDNGFIAINTLKSIQGDE